MAALLTFIQEQRAKIFPLCCLECDLKFASKESFYWENYSIYMVLDRIDAGYIHCYVAFVFARFQPLKYIDSKILIENYDRDISLAFTSWVVCWKLGANTNGFGLHRNNVGLEWPFSLRFSYFFWVQNLQLWKKFLDFCLGMELK